MVAKRIFITILSLLVSLSGCISGGPRDVKGLGEEYVSLWGKEVAPPTLEKERLFLYIRLAPEDGQEVGRVVVCVAENRSDEGILRRLSERVVESDKPLYVFGQPVKGKWKEYMEGVDFEVYAVSYYNPKAEKYQTIITTYGPGLGDMLRSVTWGDFVKMVASRGIKAAIP